MKVIFYICLSCFVLLACETGESSSDYKETYDGGGARYYGQVTENDEKMGFGKYTYPSYNSDDKQNYTGYWSFGNEEGLGLVEYDNGTKSFGNWRYNSEQGMMLRTYEDGYYFGYIENDKPSHIGTYYYNNGNKFVCHWVNGVPDDKGILYYKDEPRYEGQIKNGVKHGSGKLYIKEGDKEAVLESTWYLDKINGLAVYTSAEGKTYRGVLNRGKGKLLNTENENDTKEFNL